MHHKLDCLLVLKFKKKKKKEKEKEHQITSCAIGWPIRGSVFNKMFMSCALQTDWFL